MTATQKTRIAVVATVVVGLLVAYRLGVLQAFRDPAHVKQVLVDLGPWGYLAFVGAYAVFQPFGIPGTVFVLAAPLIWPWPIAYALSIVGTMAASVVGFSFARFILREKARNWIGKLVPARFHAYDAALEKRAFATVFTLRLVFWMPPLLHVFFGVSRVRFWTHFWGSFFGYLLPLFAMAYFGQKLFDAMRNAPRETWVAALVVAVAVFTGGFILSRRAAAKAAKDAKIAERASGQS